MQPSLEPDKFVPVLDAADLGDNGDDGNIHYA